MAEESHARAAHFDGNVRSPLLPGAGGHPRRQPARDRDSSPGHSQACPSLLSKQKPPLRDHEPEAKLERADALRQKTVVFPLPGHEPVVSESPAPGLAESIGAHRELDLNRFSGPRKPPETRERAGEKSIPPANPEPPRRAPLFACFEAEAKRLRKLPPGISDDSRIERLRPGRSLRLRASRTPNPLASPSR